MTPPRPARRAVGDDRLPQYLPDRTLKVFKRLAVASHRIEITPVFRPRHQVGQRRGPATERQQVGQCTRSAPTLPDKRIWEPLIDRPSPADVGKSAGNEHGAETMKAKSSASHAAGAPRVHAKPRWRASEETNYSCGPGPSCRYSPEMNNRAVSTAEGDWGLPTEVYATLR